MSKKQKLSNERILMLHKSGCDNWLAGIEGDYLEAALRRSPDYTNEELRLVMDGWVYCEVTFKNSIVVTIKSIKKHSGEGK